MNNTGTHCSMDDSQNNHTELKKKHIKMSTCSMIPVIWLSTKCKLTYIERNVVAWVGGAGKGRREGL